jgi:hypothetical protein
MRRQALSVEEWQKLPSEHDVQIKAELLSVAQQETTCHICRKVCHTIVQIFIIAGLDGRWPELLQFIEHNSQQADPKARAIGWSLLASLAAYVPQQVFQAVQSFKVQLLQSLVKIAEVNTEHLKWEIEAATKASCSILTAVASAGAETLPQHADLLEGVVKCVSGALNLGQQEFATDGIQALIDVAQKASPLFVVTADGVASLMLQVAKSSQLDGSTRQAALELLLTIAEQQPKIFQLRPSLVDGILPLGFEMACEVEDDISEWVEEETNTISSDNGMSNDAGCSPFTDDESNAKMGEESMRRLVLALGSKYTLQFYLTAVQGLIADSDWRKRHCAIVCAIQLVLTCTKSIQVHVPTLVAMVAATLTGDANQRVRYAAVECLAVMCIGFDGAVQKTHHAAIAPALLTMIQDGSLCPKVPYLSSSHLSFRIQTPPQLPSDQHSSTPCVFVRPSPLRSTICVYALIFHYTPDLTSTTSTLPT